MKFLEVILPVPIGRSFTYAASGSMADAVQVGCRVIVSFGASKLYTGIVLSMSDSAPSSDFEIKEIVDLIDKNPIVGAQELRLWEWMSNYYMCSLGDVMKAALPGGLKITSETTVCLKDDFIAWDSLTKQETLVAELLADGKKKTIAALQKSFVTQQQAQNALKQPAAAQQKSSLHASLLRSVRSLMKKGALEISETLTESFKPKKESHVRLAKQYLSEKALNELFETAQKTPRRYALLLKLVEMASVDTALRLKNLSLLNEVSRAALLKESGASSAVLLALKAKGIVEIYDFEVNRLKSCRGTVGEQLPLSEAQQQAMDGINEVFKQKNVCLLHGVTSCGKTEIYIRLIKQMLAQGKQVLYLLPEIALTTQITQRLQRVFGDQMGVYHSKFPDAERVELWQKQLSDKPFKLILGVRSSLFLPQKNLGLVIVDEEHETSYKQQDPAPRYSARDTAIVLATMHGAKVLLGTATPAVESYYNAVNGKYGYVRLDKRFGDIMLPEIEVVDVQDLMRRKMMQLPFSPQLEAEIKSALQNGEQVILFQNRRGYAPVVECSTCGWVPTCQYCDVSLTYHHDDRKLHCHYCGNSFAVPPKCPNCEGHDLRSHGFGTEKIEEEVHKHFPQARTARLDLDTTRSRSAYQRIIGDFAEGKTDVLIGTQMVSKGLDFDRVHVVGILDADSMMNRPDFRSHERAYQMMSQVAGRAGRRTRRGKVILQTRRAGHELIGQIVRGDYDAMCREQLAERQQFYYPPFFRLIYVWFKHRDERVVDEAARLMASLMTQAFGGGVLGPDKPSVAKVQMLHLRKAALKVSPAMPADTVRARLRAIQDQVAANPRLRSVTIYFDVDPL